MTYSLRIYSFLPFHTVFGRTMRSSHLLCLPFGTATYNDILLFFSVFHNSTASLSMNWIEQHLVFLFCIPQFHSKSIHELDRTAAMTSWKEQRIFLFTAHWFLIPFQSYPPHIAFQKVRLPHLSGQSAYFGLTFYKSPLIFLAHHL
ncbi:hypothetical protein KP509_14G088300 [Ceratopteris richardii]|uniref:Uncharacterized protein n=1 Tax=Ceratopteris richardii TaxID=49495 RepID=A0A8T2TF90_CERRI|nr:hypothetical protein KP509_14G088300 [Ceratopteris richardii]